MPNTNAFTLEEINQILEQLNAHPGARLQYIGSRYVPTFGRKGENSDEWDNSGTYEPLTIVLYQGNSYTSRQFVPAGIEITNEEYWANTGNYNAQIEQYRQEVTQVINEINPETTTTFGTAAYKDFTSEPSENSNELATSGSVYSALTVPLIINGLINVKRFGARGDNQTDDTTAIEKSIQYAIENGYNGIFFPFGNYLCGPITITQPNFTLAGPDNFENFSSLIFNDDSGTLLTFASVSGMTVCNLELKSENRNANGIVLTPIASDADSKIVNCLFVQLDQAITTTGRNVHVEKCIFSNCNSVWKMNPPSDNQYRGMKFNENSIHSCGYEEFSDAPDEIDNNDYWIIELINSNTSGFYQGCFEIVRNTVDGNSIIPFFKGSVNSVIFKNNSFNSNRNTLIVYSPSSESNRITGNWSMPFIFENNSMYVVGSYQEMENALNKYAVYIDTSGASLNTEICIIGNVFNGGTISTIYLNNARNRILANTFKNWGLSTDQLIKSCITLLGAITTQSTNISSNAFLTTALSTYKAAFSINESGFSNTGNSFENCQTSASS